MYCNQKTSKPSLAETAGGCSSCFGCSLMLFGLGLVMLGVVITIMVSGSLLLVL
jgi:hypothetical protein